MKMLGALRLTAVLPYHIPDRAASVPGFCRSGRKHCRRSGIECWEVIVLAIVQTDVPMTSGRCEAAIRQLVEVYPFVETRVLTTTAYGRAVMALEFGSGDRRVLYTAAHHGNEWITAAVLLKFVEELAHAVQNDGTLYGIHAMNVVQASTLYVVPMVDPDGVDLVTGAISQGSEAYQAAQKIAAKYPDIPFPEGWKANLMGVDLNLQYPAGWLTAREIKFSQGYTRPAPRDYVGRAPLNQRESLALAQYTETVDPTLVLAYHTQGRQIFWQFEDYEIPGAQDLAEEFARLSGYGLDRVPYQSGFAGYKDWFIQAFRRPGFTIEAGEGKNPLPLSQFPQIYRDNLGILMTAALGLPGGV